MEHEAATRGGPLARWLPLALVAGALAFASYFPFRLGFDGPYRAENRASFGAGGRLSVAEPSIVRTPGPPVWLARAIAEGDFHLALDVRSRSADQRGPARIFSLSRDHHERNLTVAQDGTSLVVRIRRHGSDLDGQPALEIEDVFTPEAVEAGAVRRIEIDVREAIRVSVAGVGSLSLPAAGRPLETWDATHRLALGDEHTGSRAFDGVLVRAEVRAGGATFDCLDPATLDVPARSWHVPERALRALEPDQGVFASTMVWHFTIFVPLGWLLARARRARRPYAAVAASAALIGFVLESGKLLFVDRHPTLLHVVPNAAGAVLGAWIFRRLSSAREDRARST